MSNSFLLRYKIGYSILDYLCIVEIIIIDLFSLYVLFSHFRPCDATPENTFFQVSSYARANVRITCEKTKGKFL